MANIVEIASRLPGVFCGSLFSHTGSQVFKMRNSLNHTPENLMVKCLNAKKETVYSDFINDNKRTEELFISADAVITDLDEAKDLKSTICELIKEARNRNPKLVWIDITDFGTGPYEHYQSSEKVLNAVGGFSYFHGDVRREPLLGPKGRSYMIVGMYSYLAAVAAIIGAKRTNKGHDLELSGVEVLAGMLMAIPNQYNYSGFITPRGERFGSSPLGLFKVKDGYVAITTVSSEEWKRLAEHLGGRVLAQDTRYDSPPKRFERRKELERMMEEKWVDMCKDEVVKVTQEASVSSAKSSTVEDLLNCPQLKSRGFWLSQHEESGEICIPNLSLFNT
jgi:crotonobetainyl-CoA:carnitine CoA-transferase CaiB-like acyl-CoA transferase